MNAKELLAKFPDLEHEGEDSHLHDRCCPNCGRRDEINISASAWFQIEEDGPGEPLGIEWDLDSKCRCGACHHIANLNAFTIAGLDAAIKERESWHAEE